VAEAFYRDHHAYSEKDVHDLIELRERSGGGGFITTEKDAINLGGFLPAVHPLAVVRVTIELVDSARVLDKLLEAVGRHERSVPRSVGAASQPGKFRDVSKADS